MTDLIRWLNASTAARDEEMFAALYAELHMNARGRMAAKRGAGQETAQSQNALLIAAPAAGERLLGIHEVLDRLENKSKVPVGFSRPVTRVPVRCP